MDFQEIEKKRGFSWFSRKSVIFHNIWKVCLFSNMVLFRGLFNFGEIRYFRGRVRSNIGLRSKIRCFLWNFKKDCIYPRFLVSLLSSSLLIDGRKPDTATAPVLESKYFKYWVLYKAYLCRAVQNRENFNFLWDFKEIRDFSQKIEVSDIREFFAKRKI